MQACMLKREKEETSLDLTGGEEEGELLDADAAEPLHCAGTIAGKGELEEFGCCIRLCGGKGAHHAASGVEPDRLCVRDSSWWWEQPEHDGGQIETPTGAQPVFVAVRPSKGVEHAAEEGVTECDC